MMKTNSIKPRRIRMDSTTLEANITYPTDVGLIHQTVRTLIRTAGKPGERIKSHVRATKKAIARLGASLKVNKKERKARAMKTLRAVTTLARETVDESRQALKRIRESAAKGTSPPVAS